MKKLMLLTILLTGMILVQGCGGTKDNLIIGNELFQQLNTLQPGRMPDQMPNQITFIDLEFSNWPYVSQKTYQECRRGK